MRIRMPVGLTKYTVASGTVYTSDANGVISTSVLADVADLLRAGGVFALGLQSARCAFIAPIAAELISIKAAAAAANGAITIAAQPKHPTKLQIRQVIVTAITAGTLTLVGIDARGNAITEVIDLAAAATITKSTAKAFAKLTSGTVAGLTGGGDGMLVICVGTALGLPRPAQCQALSVFKAGVSANGSGAPADEAVGTVDAVAGTIAPTTAADGIKCFEFWYQFA